MTYIFMMIKHKLEKNTVINKIVPDFMDTPYLQRIWRIKKLGVTFKTPCINYLNPIVGKHKISNC